MDQPQLYEIKKDSKGNYLYIKSDDIITLESKLKVFESFKNNKTLPRNLRVLDCVGNSTLSFNLSGIRQIMKKALEVTEEYDSISYAVVLNKALYVAYLIYADTIFSNSKFSIKVFSTLKAAKIWLEK
ncbi:MAG: hypothetical protein Q8T08_09885 [Ignavibacteria bacterium]|nr:hypothetical protein [Ignavibacteria bacterium]